MEREQYDLMFRQEERHWWYVGMRRISIALLDRFPPRQPEPNGDTASRLEILDAGCGSGGMTRYLAERGRVTGMDLSPRALTFARCRRVERLVRGSIDALPIRSASFDLVTSFDVLYHLAVADDVVALEELHRVLRPGGVLLIRVPAYDWIRGAHDDAVHTRHRYTRQELVAKMRASGLVVEHASYANSLLFPLAPAKRFLERRNGGGGGVTDLWLPPGPLNRLLAELLALEAALVSTTGLRWGLSVFAVGRRAESRVSSHGSRVVHAAG
ncbi:MAG TPA: class I SAM-dependent methyltransferase [Chloroflexota bacterium]|nr:class I SAM-dependent methyltransferase [Chloroflexota bacterium]